MPRVRPVPVGPTSLLFEASTSIEPPPAFPVTLVATLGPPPPVVGDALPVVGVVLDELLLLLHAAASKMMASPTMTDRWMLRRIVPPFQGWVGTLPPTRPFF